MMPILRRTEVGFTLMELVIVLAIIGLLAIIVAPRLSHPNSQTMSRQRLAVLKEALIAGKARARASGQAFSLDVSVFLPGSRFESALSSESTAIVLYPDGSSNGGTILQNGHPIASIDWLTVAVSPAQES